LVNKKSEAEARVEEISGVAFIFNQKFFKELNAVTGIDLENIVYYKDETHYFVMTAKKQSLLSKGVIIQVYITFGSYSNLGIPSLKIIDVYTCYLLGLPGHGEAIVDREC
jgi:hypothetical protein